MDSEFIRVAKQLNLFAVISLPDVDAAGPRRIFWALLGQHLLHGGTLTVEQEYLKSPAFATFFHRSSQFLTHKSTSKYSVHDAIQFECLYRLHSCPTVADDSGCQCQCGRDHNALIWTAIECLGLDRGYMVCGEEGESEHSVLS